VLMVGVEERVPVMTSFSGGTTYNSALTNIEDQHICLSVRICTSAGPIEILWLCILVCRTIYTQTCSLLLRRVC
jgi:hypothetical protein